MQKGFAPALNAVQRGLPVHLHERLRVVKPSTQQETVQNGIILYWMRNCLRGHENPALDVAATVAGALEKPLLVFLHIEDQYPYATARRQTFLLEGAREAQAEIQGKGFHAISHADRKGDRAWDRLLAIAESADLIITEEPFCAPWLTGLEWLQEKSLAASLWLVDCASVVPSAVVPPKNCHRAYAYEKATKEQHEHRLKLPWPFTDPPPELELPLEVESLVREMEIGTDLESLVREMEVDLAVQAVNHTRGGSTAGYSRWNTWVASGGLKTYAKRRNDSLDPHGVSRMSAYLNAGMVSPMRIAHEASSAHGSGKAKFLNEFLTWRGLAYAHFYHFPMAASGPTLAQLPAWAQKTLRAHAEDHRRVIAKDQLMEGHSNNPAWDGMQRYLVESGELHNNARMGWGQAVLKWTCSPEEALDVLVELNNRFALDGHAPPSFAGILWCFGSFQGPKQEKPVIGQVSSAALKSRYADMPQKLKSLHSPAPLEGVKEVAPSRGQHSKLTVVVEPSCKRSAVSKSSSLQLQGIQMQYISVDVFGLSSFLLVFTVLSRSFGFLKPMQRLQQPLMHA